MELGAPQPEYGAEESDHLPWLDRWLEQDFSWQGLANKPGWGSQGNLQEFLRSYTRARKSDEQLAADSALVQCGERGLFHVLFIPPEWTRGPEVFPFTEDELVRAQASIWDGLRPRLGDTFSGTLTGIHLSEGSGAALMSSTRASYAWTSFHGKVGGIPKLANRRFENCLFRATITLRGKINEARQPQISFSECEIESDVFLSGLEGVQEVYFDTCVIEGRLDFETTCAPRIRIHQCGISTFDSLGCIFQEEVDIFESEIGRFSLARSIFEKPISLVLVGLEDSIELLDCDFKGRVTFSDVSWPPPRQLTVSGEGSKFYSTVSFGGSDPPPVQMFQNAEFASSVAFSTNSDKALKNAFFAELGASNPSGGKFVHAIAVENGCRTLRKLAETRGDVHQEHFWHRAEIIARRARGERWGAEKGSSILYGWVADYGLSISRPFLTLLLVSAVFALAYAWLGGPAYVGTSVDLSSLQEGVGFPLNRTIPIGVFADEDNIWRKELVGSGGQIGGIAIRTMATTQSVISAILIYLGVMSVRRKFRIS